MWPKREWARHRGAGQGGSLGTAETHLMRLTLVDVKEGRLTGCTTAILGTTAIDKEKHTRTHTHTHCFLKGFRFPKKQKKRKKQRREQAIPKRVLQSDRQQLVAATVQRVLISFYWENCGCSETAPTTTTPPSPFAPLPHSLCLWFVIQINRKKEEQQQQQEGKQLCEQLKLFDDIENCMGKGCGAGGKGSCGWNSGGAATAAGGAGAAALAINGQRCRRGKCVTGQFRAGRRRLI